MECRRFTVMLNKMIQSSIYLRSVRLHGRLLHGLGSNMTARQYSHFHYYDRYNTSPQVNNSEKYPGYKLVYTFPYIHYVSLIKTMKRNQTVFSGICIPVAIGLQMLNLISYNDCIAISCTCLLFTLWIHVTFYMCTNLIGRVYLKTDDEEVILSYLNYWGKRIDFKTSIQNIVPITDSPLNFAHGFYRKLDIASCKQKLKICLKYGKITEKTHFKTIFGDV